MTDAGWVEKVVLRASAKPGVDVDAQIRELCIRLVRREHARAVRIVKAEIRRVKLDQFSYNADEKCVMVNSLESVLTALQRGRGGKG